MEMIMTIVSVLTGAASGGIVGAIGGLLSKFFEHQEKIALEQLKLEVYKVKTTYDIAMADKQNETLKMQLDNNFKQTSIEAQSMYDKTSFDALKSSYENDKSNYATGEQASNSKAFIFVDFLRGVTRPLLTWVLVGSVMAITGYVLLAIKAQLPELAQKEGISLLTYLIQTLSFLASTSTTYWFASRTVGPKVEDSTRISTNLPFAPQILPKATTVAK